MDVQLFSVNFKVRFSGITALDGKKWAENTQHRKKVNQAWKDLPEVELETPFDLKKKKKKKS